MSLQKCPELGCGFLSFHKAPACPRCGRPDPHGWYASMERRLRLRRLLIGGTMVVAALAYSVVSVLPKIGEHGFLHNFSKTH